MTLISSINWEFKCKFIYTSENEFRISRTINFSSNIRDTTRVEYVKVGLKEFRVEFGLSLTPASLRAPDGGVDSSKMNALVLQVKELLPDLGEDFIQVPFTSLYSFLSLLFNHLFSVLLRFV